MENLMNEQILYFSTTTCGPCKIMKPIVEEVTSEKGIKIKYLSIDTMDNGRDIAASFGVSSVPTIIFIKDGVEQNRMIGMRSKDKFIEACENHL